MPRVGDYYIKKDRFESNEALPYCIKITEVATWKISYTIGKWQIGTRGSVDIISHLTFNEVYIKTNKLKGLVEIGF